jgi:polar amino acid transport system substrate-binding protein
VSTALAQETHVKKHTIPIATGAAVAVLAALTGCSTSASTDVAATSDASSSVSAACSDLQSQYGSLKGTTIKVATDPEIPNYSFIDKTQSNTVQGFNMDWTTAVTDCLGMKYTVVQTSFDGLIPALLAGRADTVNSNLVATTDRLKQVDFVTFQKQIEVFLRAKGNPKGISSIADLCGNRIAVVPSSLEQALAVQQSKQCTDDGKKPVTIATYKDLAGGTQAVLTGRSDVFMEPDSFAIESVKANADELEYSDRIPEGDTFIGWALQKSDTDLGKALEAASKALQSDGTEAKLFTKWKQSADYVSDVTYMTK